MRVFVGNLALVVLAYLYSYAGALPTRQLVVTRSTSTNVPFFPYYGPPISDKDGDLFFHLGGDQYTNATLMRLAHSSWEPTLYKLPTDLQQTKYQFYEFAVSPSGDLWMVLNAGPDLLAVGFDSSGQETGRTKLELSLTDVDIADVVALGNDVLFCYGVTVGKDAGHSFAAFLDSTTGKNIRMRRDIFTSAKAGVKEQPWVHSGVASLGDDGNIYVLRESEVLAISPAGEVVKRIKFIKPIQNLTPISVRASLGYAAVWLNSTREGRSENSYLVLDLSSGKTLGWYVPPPEIKAPAMSFSRNDGFEFLVIKNGKLSVTEADLR